MQTLEEAARQFHDDYFPGVHCAGDCEFIKAVTALLRTERAATRERCAQAVRGQANLLPADVDDGFYAGYKLAIANALTAVRAVGD